jgi:DNA-binding IclR family transcriptional regulator
MQSGALIDRQGERGMEGQDAGGVKSAARILDLLELLGSDERGYRLSDVVSELGFPKSSCLMLLRTLDMRGYAERDADGCYRLRRAYREGGGWVSGRFALLREIALPELTRLSESITQTAVLGVLTAKPDIRVIATVASKGDIRYEIPLGARFPLFCSAMGRCALAFGSAEFREAYLAHEPRPQLTRHTVTDINQLHRIIDKVRSERYAINVEEHVIGVISVAAPILDADGKFLGTINVGCVTPSFHENGPAIESAVHKAGETISRLVQNA